MIKDILKTLRINHYLKNTIVFVPLFISMNFSNPTMWLKAAIIFVAFCLISSAVYIMNDLIDIEKDKLHPAKKFRPIASGRISKILAAFLLAALLVTSVIISLTINKLCFLAIISYFSLNIFYSLFLKNIAIIDAASIAIGFILRITGGCWAIRVIPSALVILLTFFSSMFFTFTKRKFEFQLLGSNSRQSIKKINIETINQFILANGILSIAFYFSYVLDESTILKAGTKYLYITVIPFSIIVFRLLLLSFSTNNKDDPIFLVENDKVIKYMSCIYLITLYIVLVFIK